MRMGLGWEAKIIRLDGIGMRLDGIGMQLDGIGTRLGCYENEARAG